MRPDAPPQVLVVEPDAALQAAVATWLERAGYDCVPVSDADEALAIAEDDEADVALVSSPIAAWSVSHLAIALQARDADLPVIVVRSGADPRRARLGGRLGALEEIPAPLTRGAVMHAVVRALEWRGWSPDARQRYVEAERAMAREAALVREAVLGEPCSTDGLIGGLLAFADRRVPGLMAEAARVRAVATAVGAAIGLDGAALAAVDQAAALQGLGLALLPPSLRRGDGGDGFARAVARRLPEVVHDLLGQVPALREAAQLVYASHERFDGSGHPRGLGGLEIPMGARIIGLARAVAPIGGIAPGVTPAAGAAVVTRAGGELDPDLVRVWLRLAEREGVPTLH